MAAIASVSYLLDPIHPNVKKVSLTLVVCGQSGNCDRVGRGHGSIRKSPKGKNEKQRRARKPPGGQVGGRSPSGSGAGSSQLRLRADWRGRARRFVRLAAPIFYTAVIAAIIATAFNLWSAPLQATRQQGGLDASQAASDAATPDLVVQDVRVTASTSSGYSDASQAVYGLDEVKRYARLGQGPTNRFLPPDKTNVRIGDIVGRRGQVQPETASQVNLTLVGNHNRPVRISAFTIYVVRRAEPPSGTLFLGGEQGDTPDTTMGFDLDSDDLNAQNLTGAVVPALAPGHYLDSHQITLQKNESVSFRIVVFARDGLYDYVFKVTTDDGRTQTIDNAGGPWTISSFAKIYQHAYRFNLSDQPNPSVEECTPPSVCVTDNT